ncbi:P-loop NTPase fold protein [Pseudomonas gozinkensis]|uniref:P-loop NTPase fold protein n=1 Tax=Pseudomonas gozinkensis TaxID=2774461 RepID=UPI0017880112
METEKSNSDWNDSEIDAAVDAYISMLSREQTGQKFVKTEENRILREGALIGRTKGSVEFRMQNISAVLEELGLPRINGYKPAKNVGNHIRDRILARLTEKNLIPQSSKPSDYSRETLFHSDDPWAVGLEDKIGVVDEAKAMATLAIRTEDPPLAIGVLGDWGTGKSFFMRLVYQQIQRDSKDTVLIKFNAWHFVDTNLWASLVDHIFTELDQWVRKNEIEGESRLSSQKLFENLSTAQELAVESAEKLVLCRQAQSIATKRLAEARDNNNAFWQSITETLKKQVDFEKVKSAAKTLGLEKLYEDTFQLKKTIDAFNNERTRTKAIREGLLHRIASWQAILIGLTIILILPPAFSKAFELISETFKANISIFTKEILTLSTTITGITAGIAFLTKHIRSAVNQISGFRTTLEKVIDAQEKSKSKTLSKLATDVEEAQNLLTVATEKVAAATHDFDAGTGRGRMLSFIRERANDGHYASHLGLVAAIRKDFEELSRGLKTDSNQSKMPILDGKLKKRILDLIDDPKSQLKSADKEKLESMLKVSSVTETQKFKRIVLFIDDLDRCPPTKVVEILQAVHLLLGFPLFIVFVAADVRWVNRALTKHYPDLLDEQHAESFNKKIGATAHDYLEKIFQIPYWVRPMSANSSAALLESRIQNFNTDTTSLSTSPITSDEAITNNTADSTEDFSDNSKEKTQNNRLIFSNDERTFLSQLAPFAGNSPRRVLRFINTYRIIKISLSDEENEALEQRYFRELLLSLAISIGTPEAFNSWSQFIQSGPTNTDLRTLLKKSDLQPWHRLSSSNTTLQGAVQTYLRTNTSGSIQDTIEASKLVKRYSFIG